MPRHTFHRQESKQYIVVSLKKKQFPAANIGLISKRTTSSLLLPAPDFRIQAILSEIQPSQKYLLRNG